jgi:hypothetical protein
MFDHFTQFSAVQEKLASTQEEVFTFRFFNGPAVQLEKLPQGLIEDQI